MANAPQLTNCLHFKGLALQQEITLYNNINEKTTRFRLAEKGVQLFCNTSAKSVIPLQITHRNSGL